jgi:aromatic-L-amino-acid decarboxylase
MEDLVIYTTTQTHSLGLKAGLVLGLSVRALEVKSEDNFALRGMTLQAALEEDRLQGKKPFILSKSHQVDSKRMSRHPSIQLPLLARPLQEQLTIYLKYSRLVCSTSLLHLIMLSNRCLVRSHTSLWVHVDAAWAGVALSCPEHREKCYLEDINNFANSFCTNFHKVCMPAIQPRDISCVNSGALLTLMLQHYGCETENI